MYSVSRKLPFLSFVSSAFGSGKRRATKGVKKEKHDIKKQPREEQKQRKEERKRDMHVIMS